MTDRVRETGAIKNPVFFKIGLIIFIMCLIFMMFKELAERERRKEYERYIEPLEHFQDSIIFEIEQQMDSIKSALITYYAKKDGNN